MAPEVVKMNKKDIEAYLNGEYSTIIERERLRKSRGNFRDTKPRPEARAALLSKSVIDERIFFFFQVACFRQSRCLSKPTFQKQEKKRLQC